jgi:predicted RND superfamily exporter protein
MINAYLKYVIRRPVLFLSLLALITAGLGSGILELRFDHSVEAFMPKDDPDYREYVKAQEIFGDNSRFLILAVSHPDLWSAEALSAFDRLLVDIEAYKEYRPEQMKARMKKLNRLLEQPDAGFEEIAAAFPNDPEFARLIRRSAPPALKKAARLSQDARRRLVRAVREGASLQKTELVETILSPFTANDVTGAGGVLETYPLIEEDAQGNRIIPRTTGEIRAFQKRLSRNPAFANGIYAVDEETGRITDFGVVIKFAGSQHRPEVVGEIMEIARFHDGLDVAMSGVPYVSRQFTLYMEEDLYRTTPLVLLVVTLVFFFNFKSLRGVVLPLFTLGMAEIWTLGLMGHLDRPITAIAVTLPPLLISVGSSYAIHILNQYYADFSRIDPRQKAAGIASVMSHISITVALAGITTAAAFVTLVSSQVTAIQQWAVFSALGIVFAVVIGITLIPAALSLLPHRYRESILKKQIQEARPSLVDRLLAATAAGAVRHYKAVYAVVFVVLAVSAAGMLHLRVNTEFLHYFKKSDPTYQNTVAVGKKLGGAWGLNIIIDSGETNGVKSPKFLKTMERLREWLVAGENRDLNIGRTDAFSDFIKRMHMAMHNDEPDWFRIPDDRLTILDYLEIYSGEDSDSDGVYDDFESFVDVFYQKSAVVARLSDKDDDRMGTSEIRYIIEKIEDHLEAVLPDAYSFSITGYPVINVKLAHYVVMSQLIGLLLSLAFVMLVVMVLFRKIAAGPLALIDMGVTILVNFGVMGWLGIELDMVTSVIATITIGIGVDDTIHFLNTYRVNRPEAPSMEAAVEKTLFVSGKAIVFTSMALTFGFLSMVTSNFLPIVLFSLLISLTMINTTIGSILLIPAAMRLTGIKLER